MFEGYHTMKARGVEKFGIHAFLASNTVTNEYYPVLARQLFELAVELKEETGLDFSPLTVDEMYHKPFFTTIGMTDESCATVYGYAAGSVSGEGLEDNEQLEVVLADRTEIARILKEENVSMNCGYLMMHFLHHTDEDPFYFLKPGPLQKE